MTSYAQLSAVRIGYDERGAGEPVLLLHGGAVDARFFDGNLDTLSAGYHLFTPDLRGHGRTADVEGAFSYDQLAADVIEFLETVVGGRAHVAGHSVGAGVAVYVALRRPDLVRKLVLISGAFHHDGLLTGDDIDVDQVVAGFGAAYGAVSPDGEAHFRVVVEKIAALDRHEPAKTEADLGSIPNRTLVMTADDDIITLEHTLALYRGIADSELAVVPGTSHFLVQEKGALCAAIVADFLGSDAVATIAPIRRS